jgi:hypothetical protein
MTNVKKSTANNIFRHAETNAMDKRIKEAIDSAMGRDSGAIEECLRNVNAGERASAGMDEFLARIQHSMRRLNLCEAENPDTRPAADPRPAVLPEPDPERILDRVVGTELSLQELIAADVLDPKKRLGRPQALTEAEKDHLVSTVKRDFKTRRRRVKGNCR